jgi:polar amino acid transport system permease protein
MARPSSAAPLLQRDGNFMGYTLNFSAVWRSFDLLLQGLALSLGLAVMGIAIGCVIGLVTAFGLLSKNALLRRPAQLYVTIIRNTPILVLILFAYFALPQMGVRLGKIESFVATLAVYSGAYLAEIFRGGLLAVPRGLKEAGLAIGLRQSQIRNTIVIPLMLRNVLPSLSSTLISLFKDTSLAAAIAVPELTFQARKINVESFRVIETWIVTSLLYVATCTVLAALLRRLEKRMSVPR